MGVDEVEDGSAVADRPRGQTAKKKGLGLEHEDLRSTVNDSPTQRSNASQADRSAEHSS